MKKKICIVVAFVSLIFMASCGLNVSNPSFSIDRIEDENTDYVEVESDFTKTVEETLNSCVGVYSKGTTSASIGSGVIYKMLDRDTNEEVTDKTTTALCYIVTNEHVVNLKSEKGKYSIYLGNEIYRDASLVGTDSTNDLAVLTFTVNPKTYPLKPIKGFYETDKNSIIDIAKPGQIAFAIGCPISFEYYNYVSYGNVAGVSLNEIKHTASINPGNSGGGLFNSQGRLLGINVRKVVSIPDGDSEISAEGLAEAIPVWTVRNSVEEIESMRKNIVRPKLGIQCQNINISLNPEDSSLLPPTYNFGVVVNSVEKSSNAELAGLKSGDMILSLSTNKITDLVMDKVDVIRVSDIEYFMNNTKKGDTIYIEVYRNNSASVDDERLANWEIEVLKVELK